MTKREKVRFILGKCSAIFLILALVLSVFIIGFSAFSRKSIKVRAATGSTYDYLYSQYNTALNIYGSDFPYTLGENFDSLLYNLPSRYGTNAYGNAKRFDFSSFDFSDKNGIDGIFSLNTIDLPLESSSIGSFGNTPYRFFAVAPNSNGMPTSNYMEYFLVYDTLADGSIRYYQYFFEFSDNSTSAVCCSIPVRSTSNVITPQQLYDQTPSFMNSLADVHSAYGYQDTFLLYDSSTKYQTVLILPSYEGIVSRKLWYRANVYAHRYQFLDSDYLSGEYYSTLWEDVWQIIGKTLSSNSSFLKSLKTDFEKTISDLRSENSALASSVAEYKASYDSLFNDMAQLQSRYNTLLQEKNNLSATVDSLNSQLAELQLDYATVVKNYSQLTVEKNGLQVSLNTLRSQYDEALSTISAKDEEIAGFESEIETLNGDISSLNSSLSSLQSSYDTLQNNYNNLVLANEDLESALTTVRDQAFKDGVSSVEAMNDVLTVVPDSVVKIWNGVLAPVFRFDIAGVSLGLYLAGILVIGITFWLLTKFV